MIGNWAFAGIGWRTAGDAALAAESAALAREYADQQRQRRAADQISPDLPISDSFRVSRGRSRVERSEITK